ncbi:uncharacterized protein LOC124653658 [Lolium rigidum]|uniref:uncharacterized protein LOC124653658 n=1 Tax=Lolium rigidum TaxID=89674 RepID=UPI001F5C72DC|nr:uncharacterized protein LOC124653658 [Lolium rigidum]
MGQLDLIHREQREQRFRQIQIRDGSTSSLAIRKESPCLPDEDFHDGKRRGYSGTELSEDIWCHIHSLMTPRDAARAACVSRAFLCSWRCYPNLIFNTKIMGMLQDRGFTHRVDDILKKHSGIGVKTFELDFSRCGKPKVYEYLHGWLQIAVTPGIEKLTLLMPEDEAVSFPCPVLSDENGSSIRYLHLVHCAFRPTDNLGCLRNLTELHFDWVRITGDELGCLLSSCVALERLKLTRCPEITYMKIPSWLQRLSYLQVLECQRLRMLRNEAPNIYSFHFEGDRVEVSLGESLRLKNLHMICYRFLHYVREELPYSVPNLETLNICSHSELVNTTMAFSPSKFLHLKHVGIYIIGAYDYFSLVSFLDAAPLLETFDLRVVAFQHTIGELLSDNPSQLQQMAGYHHDKLQRVKISRFYSWKSLVELTCHILKNSSSLERLTLDTTDDRFDAATSKCSYNRSDKCSFLAKPMDAHKSVLAIRKHIKGKVPSTVQLDVVEPCSRCYPVEL